MGWGDSAAAALLDEVRAVPALRANLLPGLPGARVAGLLADR